jgi:hypothetical protein
MATQRISAHIAPDPGEANRNDHFSSPGGLNPSSSGHPPQLRSVHNGSFSAIPPELDIFVLVTTYQVGKLAMLRPDGDRRNTHFRAFGKRIGLAVGDISGLGRAFGHHRWVSAESEKRFGYRPGSSRKKNQENWRGVTCSRPLYSDSSWENASEVQRQRGSPQGLKVWRHRRHSGTAPRAASCTVRLCWELATVFSHFRVCVREETQ